MLSFKNGPNDCMSSKTFSVAVFLGVTMKHNVQTSITKMILHSLAELEASISIGKLVEILQ